MNDTSIIKNEFEKMKLIRLDIKKIFNEIETKINTLKTIYIELINTHQDNTYIFGIDSFHFQNKMIESEYIYICKNFTDIENRMYCEYYKLNKIIIDYNFDFNSIYFFLYFKYLFSYFFFLEKKLINQS